MTKYISALFGALLFCSLTVLPLVAAQAKGNTPAGESAKPANVSGKWQVSLEGRLGTEEGVMQLQQDGAKLTGTFEDIHGLSPLSGTVAENRVSFDVQFGGQRPFAIRFNGSLDKAGGGEIKGTSEAILPDGSRVFLGHAGEVVHPEHPWTAKRAPNQPAASGATASPNSPARN